MEDQSRPAISELREKSIIAMETKHQHYTSRILWMAAKCKWFTWFAIKLMLKRVCVCVRRVFFFSDGLLFMLTTLLLAKFIKYINPWWGTIIPIKERKAKTLYKEIVFERFKIRRRERRRKEASFWLLINYPISCLSFINFTYNFVYNSRPR